MPHTVAKHRGFDTGGRKPDNRSHGTSVIIHHRSGQTGKAHSPLLSCGHRQYDRAPALPQHDALKPPPRQNRAARSWGEAIVLAAHAVGFERAVVDATGMDAIDNDVRQASESAAGIGKLASGAGIESKGPACDANMDASTTSRVGSKRLQSSFL